ncbi:hypothetical protein E3N88_15288 [Mikania micrantha]|uniref:Uncharacterized protein n=1 Tax=Mikania micrantha TaxID=192012 RepID=A0A5N6NWG1_9ASTR|nr:hypothetical protein E3N88_15288 [Mikania micrantha]
MRQSKTNKQDVEHNNNQNPTNCDSYNNLVGIPVELSDDVAGGPDETRLGGGGDGVDRAGGDGGLFPEMGGPGWEGVVVVDGGGVVVDVGGAGGEVDRAGVSDGEGGEEAGDTGAGGEVVSWGLN